MKIKSFAKINLGLEVVGKREDGYHQLKTLLQTVDFYDILEFIPAQGSQIVLSGNDKTISWGKDNLIHKAALFLKEKHHVSTGIEIRVEKNIPPGKGLGGGSSNAAMTLHVLNKIWRLGLEKRALMDLGKELGADVPFFLEGGLCLGTGRGDEVVPLSDLACRQCLLALPSFSISTASIYNSHRLSLTSKSKESKIIQFLNRKEIDSLENRLEETIFRLYPQLKPIKSLFRSQGSELTLVSGTGSAVFGLFLKKKEAAKALENMKRIHPAVLVETLSRERYWKGLQTGV